MILKEDFWFWLVFIQGIHSYIFTSSVPSGHAERDRSFAILGSVRVHQTKLNINKNLWFFFFFLFCFFPFSFFGPSTLFDNNRERYLLSSLTGGRKQTGLHFIDFAEDITWNCAFYHYLVSMNLKQLSFWSWRSSDKVIMAG